MKSSSFHWKAASFSTRKPYKSTNSRQILQFHCVLGGGYVWWFHGNRHFSWKLHTFHEKQQFSLGNLINQLIQDKSFSFIVCLGEAMSDDSMKTATFHENCHFSWKPPLFMKNRTKDHQLPGMVTPMFKIIVATIVHFIHNQTLFEKSENKGNILNFLIFDCESCL